VIDVPEIPAEDLISPQECESSATVALRILQARHHQLHRYQDFSSTPLLNARIDSELLQKVVHLKDETQQLLLHALQKFKISGRGYHRILRVARTIADLSNSDQIDKSHVAEALNFRRITYS
jgi:magnesium chelatase family protein